MREFYVSAQKTAHLFHLTNESKETGKVRELCPLNTDKKWTIGKQTLMFIGNELCTKEGMRLFTQKRNTDDFNNYNVHFLY